MVLSYIIHSLFLYNGFVIKKRLFPKTVLPRRCQSKRFTQVQVQIQIQVQVQVQVQVWLFHCFIVSLFDWLIDCVDILGPGPLGAPGPRCRIRVEHVTTYCQASYLLSGKLPTIRQATYCQTCKQSKQEDNGARRRASHQHCQRWM